MNISKDKTYTTRDGREVRIYAIDGCSFRPIHAAIKKDSGWESADWCRDGTFTDLDRGHDYDLIEVKPRIKVRLKGWINIHASAITVNPLLRSLTLGSVIHDSEEAAKKYSPRSVGLMYINQEVEIDCSEGEGL